MPQRKIWTEEEDRVLKFLIEVRGLTKWSVISQTMQRQFKIMGRNGKQCRERYHNHLDKNISNSQWTIQQQNKLFQLQDEVGNKWALISSKLPGRSDNCVKNHFYSKLRKSLRRLNKKIHKFMKKQYKDIKTATLYKIIQVVENKNKINFNVQHNNFQLCRKIKRSLREFEDQIENITEQDQEIDFIRSIVQDISLFDPEIKKAPRKNGLKSSKKNQEEDASPKPYSNRVSSTKSVYDQEESECSNSDLLSSSSFDHRSFYSNQSQGIYKSKKVIYRSQNIQSESQEEEDQVDLKKNELWKSTKSLVTLKKTEQQKYKQKSLTNSLKLPHSSLQTTPVHIQVKERKSSDSKSSESDRSQGQKILYCPTQNMDMMGDPQQFPPYVKMRLFSPKKPNHDDLMEMDNQRDDLFYGQKMEIENQRLVQNFSGLGLSDMPKLGFQFDL